MVVYDLNLPLIILWMPMRNLQGLPWSEVADDIKGVELAIWAIDAFLSIDDSFNLGNFDIHLLDLGLFLLDLLYDAPCKVYLLLLDHLMAKCAKVE